jgi:hypothetical protein
MTEADRQKHRADWTARLAKQPPHPVYQPIEVLWDEPWGPDGCTLRRVERLAIDEAHLDSLQFHVREQRLRVTWEQVKQWETLQKSWIDRMKHDPFQYGWISEYFRPILIQLCRKRLAHPGEVIEFLCTGGNRPGKTKTLLHLVDCNYIYAPRPIGSETDDTWQGQVMVLHETEGMSRKWHHPEVFHHLPRDLRIQARKKSTVETAFNYNAKGFTNDWFQVFVDVEDETGRKFTGGGRFELRNYGQDEDTFQGGEYNTILSDELIPPALVKTLNARLASRVELTREPWFQDRIRHLLQLLEANEPFNLIHRALLGLVIQGVHVIAFTPIKGYTATVKMFLAGAKKYGWAPAPCLLKIAGAPKAEVPRFAQPKDPLRLVAYLPTSANIWKPAYHAILGGAMSGGHRQVRMKLYGDVEQDQRSEFSAAYDPDMHLCGWKDLPRTGTLYEVFDPAGAKPWAMGWYLVDELDRIFMVQEWPCESILINDAEPGPWAIVSAGDRMNGDEGPAYELRLAWSITRWVRQIWEGRARIVTMMAKTGKPWKGEIETRKLLLAPGVEDKENRYAKPERSIIDSRFAGTKVESAKGGEQVTVLERLFEDENAILCEPAQGVALDEGNLLIADKLAERVLGDQPALRINRECTNTQFMLENYTLPEFRSTTAKKDEACKEWRDLLAYLLLARPEHMGSVSFTSEGGCRD